MCFFSIYYILAAGKKLPIQVHHHISTEQNRGIAYAVANSGTFSLFIISTSDIKPFNSDIPDL